MMTLWTITSVSVMLKSSFHQLSLFLIHLMTKFQSWRHCMMIVDWFKFQCLFMEMWGFFVVVFFLPFYIHVVWLLFQYWNINWHDYFNHMLKAGHSPARTLIILCVDCTRYRCLHLDYLLTRIEDHYSTIFLLILFNDFKSAKSLCTILQSRSKMLLTLLQLFNSCFA